MPQHRTVGLQWIRYPDGGSSKTLLTDPCVDV
jgi:hypothetical protein